jgi:UDP-N-acetylglucosamine 2-epimerase (non-hydrolysing)
MLLSLILIELTRQKGCLFLHFGVYMANTISVLLVFGTRPEAIKLIPIIKILSNNPSFNLLICSSSQHLELLNSVIEDYAINVDYDLHVFQRGQSLTSITSKVLQGITEVLEQTRPDFLLVHGDTTTAFASALAGFYFGTKVIHIEAGLRTFDKMSPFPEEFNRVAVSLVADFHFAPTEVSYNNLIKEGVSPNRILVTGNTIIDLLSISYEGEFKDPILDWTGKDKFILLTAHRRENLIHMPHFFKAIRDVMINNPTIKLVYPIHKNPKIIELADKFFKGINNIKIVEALDTKTFHNILARSYYVITDSGGVQEEAPTFRVPVVLMRTSTERPEALGKGIILAGVEYDKITFIMNQLINDNNFYNHSKPLMNPFGDGQASVRIVEKIKSLYENSSV